MFVIEDREGGRVVSADVEATNLALFDDSLLNLQVPVQLVPDAGLHGFQPLPVHGETRSSGTGHALGVGMTSHHHDW